jgi:hypothetical protein
MKKLLYVLAASMCLMLAAPKQIDAQIGVRAGLNYSTLTGDITGVSSQLGYQFGLTYKMGLGGSLSFTPGLLYSTKGAYDDDFDVTYSIDYLEIPLDLNYALNDAFSLNVGPYIGMLLSANDNGVDSKDDYKSIDFGANFGLSYSINPSTFGLSYALGFANIDETSAGAFKLNNNNCQVYWNYAF